MGRRPTRGDHTERPVAGPDGRGDREPDLRWRLATAVAVHPDAPALLIATDVRVECDRGWVGRPAKARGVEVRVSYYL